MKLCFLTHEYPKEGLNPGGIGVFLKTFLPELSKQGHEIIVLGPNNSKDFEETVENGVRIIRIPNYKVPVFNWLLIAYNLSRKIDQLLPDIVEGSELSFAFLKKKNKIKYVIRLHGGHHFFSESEKRKINWWKGLQERRSFKKADAFVAISDYVLRHTAKYLSFHGKPVELIRNMVDTSKFKFSPVSTSPNPYSLVYVGTVCEKKGVENLVKSIELVREKYPLVQLDIYGKDWFFPNGNSYKNYLKTLISGNLEGAIRIHEPVPHSLVPQVYQSAEICIFPSFMETQGLVATEAMAMGKIVVFTDKGPGPETIEHGVSGYLCNPFDIRSIAETIQLAFESKSRKVEISRAARQRVQELFSVEKNLSENIRFYKKLVHA